MSDKYQPLIELCKEILPTLYDEEHYDLYHSLNDKLTALGEDVDDYEAFFKPKDGKWYHWRYGQFLTNEDDSLIPAHICICAAHSESECCCGAWGFAIPDMENL